MDPVAAKIMANLWQPNNAGDDLTGLNNFNYSEDRTYHYNNFSTRLDWQIAELEGLGTVSWIKTDQDATDYRRPDPLKLRNTTGSSATAGTSPRFGLHVQPFDLPGRSRRLLQGGGQARGPGDEHQRLFQLLVDPWWQPYMEGRPLVYAPNIRSAETRTPSASRTSGSRSHGV